MTLTIKGPYSEVPLEVQIEGGREAYDAVMDLMLKRPFETISGPKHDCRLKLIEATKEIGVTVPRILTLPSKEHLCYSTFKEGFPTSNIVCLERDKEIAAALNNKGITTECVDTTTYLESYQPWQQPFNTIFLDYYSFLTESVISDLKTIADKPNIVGDNWSVLGLTLQKSIRHDKSRIEVILDKYLRTRQNETIECDIDSVASLVACEIFRDYRVKIWHSVEYKATANSVPMWFYVFLIKR